MRFIKTTLTLAVGAFCAMAAQAEGTLDKVKSSGTFTVAYRDASIPFSYLDDKANPTGFSWEITQKIVSAVKKATGTSVLNVKRTSVTSANRIPLLTNGTIDIECGSTTNNSTRGKEVDFSTNFFYTGTRLLVKSNSGIKSVKDLKGKTVVSTTGTTNLLVLRKINAEQNLGFNLISAKDHDDSFLNVQQGRADAFGMDDILLYGLRAAAPKPTDFAVVGEAIQVEPYACMIRKNDPAFKKVVDDTINEMMASGEFTQLYHKWFESKIPPKGINLEVPMSAQLKANLKEHSDKPAL